MCGIAGILSLNGQPVDAGAVQSMCSTIAHRGPDDDGFYIRPEIGLGMRRLSIIDLTTGHQPMSNEDGTVWVVFNGEIYNYRELRQQLTARGHKLATRTDTETLVHLYEDHGAGLVDHLRGMFAFALWDSRKRQLLLGRDRLGIKPLYYANLGDRFVFASEMKAILQLEGAPRELNLVSLNHMITKLTIPSTQSIVRGVEKLEAGNILTVGRDEPARVKRYWDVVFEPNRRATEAALVDELRARIDESVRMHMISDVPVGAFLSGGMDSSSVVANMVRHTDRPVKTFAIGFREEAFNELPHARTVARAFGTDHHELLVEPDVVKLVGDLAYYLDEPLGDPSAIPTFMVSRLAAQHVKVVLSGDGGDELFAGYDKYRVEQRQRRWSRLPRVLRRALHVIGSNMREGAKGRNFLLHHSLSGWDRFFDSGSFFRRHEREQLLHPDVLAQVRNDDPMREARAWVARAAKHPGSAMQYLDLHMYLPLDILTKVDRMSMAHSLETRVPLLDHKLVEFAATIPPEMNLQGNVGKLLFKKAMTGVLPASIIERPKRGFAVPLNSWFRGELAGFARELLLSRRAIERNVFNTAYVERVLDLQRAGRPLDFHLWTLISFEMWCRTFLDAQTARVEREPLAVGADA